MIARLARQSSMRNRRHLGLDRGVTDHAGPFRFQRRLFYLANSVVNQHIGLEETDDQIWSIYSNTVLLDTLDEQDYIIRGCHPKSVTHVPGQLCYPCSRLLGSTMPIRFPTPGRQAALVLSRA